MSIDTKALLAKLDLATIVGSRLPLTARGHEYVALCPFHEENTPSFHVVPDKGFWHCFGCGANGDAIHFIEQMDGLSFKDACAYLDKSDLKALPVKHGLAAKVRQAVWVSQEPPQGCEKPESFYSHYLGNPVASWAYRSATGGILGYVCRYEVSENGNTKKSTPTWSYGTDNPLLEPSWQMKAFSVPRPLYGLDLLANCPYAPVIIVEGEKACEAARQLLPGYVCLTWPNGTGGVEHANWMPVFGRPVTLIPDHDEPGFKAMEYLSALLTSKGCAVSVVTPEATRPKGWDLADALEEEHWTPEQADEWLKKQSDSYGIVPVDPPLKAAPPAFSDDAMGRSFAATHGKDWKYIQLFDRWLNWDGRYWVTDKTAAIRAQVRLHLSDVVNQEQGALLTEAQKKSLCSKKTLDCVVSMASIDEAISSSFEQWDMNPWLLSTPGGVVDLMSGVRRAATREDHLSKITRATPEGDCPKWRSFLDQVTAGDTDLQAYLQRLSGYLLTGVTTEQSLAFFYGTGGNGKGVFLRTIQTIMGDYATNANMETFTEQKGDRHSTELARLQGARFVTAQETDEGRRWAESRLKALTGGDKVTARFMRQDDFEYVPSFKLIFAGNHKPALSSVDEAIRRRVHIVPFTVTIAKEQRDPLLDEKLKAEHDGILAWMVEGCLAWQQIGLCPPASVTKATDDYLEAEDALQGWLEENCYVGDEQEAAVSEIYKNYVDYCTSMKENPWSKKRLMQNLESRGMRPCKTCGLRTMKGISVKAETGVREW